MAQTPKVAARRRLKKFSGGTPRIQQYAKTPAGPNALSADSIASLFRWMRGVPQANSAAAEEKPDAQ